jgi:hypothetical protein
MMSRDSVPWFRRELALATSLLFPLAPLVVVAACAASNEADGTDDDGRAVVPSGDAGDASMDVAVEGDSAAGPCVVGSSLCSAPIPLTSVNVAALAGRSKNDVWASATGRLMHWDGKEWSALDSDTPETVASIFLTPDEVWGAVGSRIVRRRLAPNSTRTVTVALETRWDVFMIARIPSCIAVLPGSEVYLGLAPPPPITPSASPLVKVTFDTGQVDYLPEPLFPWGEKGGEEGFYASFLVPDRALWLVGEQGTVVRYPVSSPGDGGGPTLGAGRLVPMAYQASLRAVWGTGDDVWVAGSRGRVFHFDGSEWHAAETGTDVTLNAIFGLSATDIWAAGDDGVALHFDGTTWSRVAVGAYRGSLQAIWGSATDDVWIGGEDGMFHWGALP